MQIVVTALIVHEVWLLGQTVENPAFAVCAFTFEHKLLKCLKVMLLLY
jgi:hypothetical protein